MLQAQMSATVVQRELFPNCAVAATLSRVGQGGEWGQFIDRALSDSLIDWASPNLIGTPHSSAVIGHVSSFASLEQYIATFAAKSYSITGRRPIVRQPFMTTGSASGKIKKQSASADQYAFITIQAAPNPDSNSIQVSIPESDTVATELHDLTIPDAILDGVCLAALASDYAEPFVGFHVTVTEAKWHPVDSYSGVFKRATFMAMTDILGRHTTSQ